MIWILESGILVVVAVLLRRVLHMGRDSAPQRAPLHRLKRNASPLYGSIASEIEAHTTILGVLLNDTIEEQNSGDPEIARRMLDLFGSEWERAVELVLSLQDISLKYFPMVQSPIDARNLDARLFQSQALREFLSRHGVLDQFVFRSKLRFQLHLRLLRRATAVLNENFAEARYDAGRSSRFFAWTLTQADLYFHDLDLLAKQTLLGFNAELAYLPDAALKDINAELSVLTRNSVLSSIAVPSQR